MEQDQQKGWDAFSLQGGREDQCDAYLVRQSADGLLAIVADGHGTDGEEAARLACSYLPYALEQAKFGPGREERTVRQAFRAADLYLEGRCDGGVSLTLAYLYPGVLFTAWVGDTRACVADDQQMIYLTHDHLASDGDEAAAVIARGGIIQRRRVRLPSMVSGGLQLTRSLGDRRLGEIISPEPTMRRLSGPIFLEFRSLVIGSDGLWNEIDSCLGLPDAELTRLLHAVEPTSAALLRDRVAACDPCDNATGLLIDLRPFHPAVADTLSA